MSAVNQSPAATRLDAAASEAGLDDSGGRVSSPNWVANAGVLWAHRRKIVRVAGGSLLLSLAIAFLWPKRYESTARIMPPGDGAGGSALLAALAGRSTSLGGLGALAGGLFNSSGNTALFIDMLRSGTVAGHLIDRFRLVEYYHKRYRVDAAKYLAKCTKISDDKKSGVITITVSDADPVRARDLAQAYLDELNLMVNRTNSSSAHQERVFIEKRLQGVVADMGRAEQRLSDFSSIHATVDLKEQARAMVDAGARLQAQLIAEQAGLDAMRQVYGDENVRVRSSHARIAVLQGEMLRMSGSSEVPAQGASMASGNEPGSDSENAAYPALRQLPRLAVPYGNLYREVQVQEAVYQLLTQQYELARIEEAKDIPAVNAMDAPGIPEKKSFPPRLLLSFLLTSASVTVFVAMLLIEHQWNQVARNDPRKMLANGIGRSMQAGMLRARSLFGGDR